MPSKNHLYCPYCKHEIGLSEVHLGSVTCPNCKESFAYHKNPLSKYSSSVRSFFSQFGNQVIVVVTWLLGLPAFIFLHKKLPDPNWNYNLDRFLIVFIIVLIIWLLLKKIKKIIWVLLTVLVVFFTAGSLAGFYGFGDLVDDYRNLLLVIIDNPNPEKILIQKLKPFQNDELVKNAIDFENESVRNFAVNATVTHFKDYTKRTDYRNLIQCFAIFKEVNSNWNYVNDPESRNYFAKASESVGHLSGDCDDHSILMVACIKSIGGKARIIHTTGHMYPEVLIGSKKDLETVNYLIKRKLFVEESTGKSLYYHIDENNQVWLNLDYTAKYPGGPFMNEEILGVLSID